MQWYSDSSKWYVGVCANDAIVTTVVKFISLEFSLFDSKDKGFWI